MACKTTSFSIHSFPIICYLALWLVIPGSGISEEPLPQTPNQRAEEADVNITWEDLRNERWPGPAPSDEEFGPAFDGVRLAARPLMQHGPNNKYAAIAVWVQNENEVPMSFYGWGWSGKVLPAIQSAQSQSARIGGPKATWYGTMTVPAKGHIAYVLAAKIDGNARKDHQQLFKLEFHHVPGLSRWAPGKVMDRGYLMSAPITISWPTETAPALSEAQSLLQQALAGNTSADNQFLRHPQSVAALEATWIQGDVKRDDLLTYILRRPSLEANHLTIDLLCMRGPWTWARFRPNEWAWKMAEWEQDKPGVCTQSRARFAYALVNLSKTIMKKRKSEHHGLDTASAIYAWNKR